MSKCIASVTVVCTICVVVTTRGLTMGEPLGLLHESAYMPMKSWRAPCALYAPVRSRGSTRSTLHCCCCSPVLARERREQLSARDLCHVYAKR